MKKITINVDEEIFDEANAIMNDFGMDSEMIMRIILKRIIKENNITFLFNNSLDSKSQPFNQSNVISNIDKTQIEKMTKSRAVRLFINEGIILKGKVIFSSKNRAVANYWSNPPFYVLDEDVSLILNDTINKKLFLFNIPAGSFSKSQFIPRNDQPELIDLQIRYNDSSFEDNRSGTRFAKYLYKSIEY